MITHPMNWLVVVLMLIIAGTAGHLLLTLLGVDSAVSKVNPNLGVGQTLAGKSYNNVPQ
jgi:hypothetical protein